MFQIRFYKAIIIVLLGLESATASCLEYGHSCWGAHGKRSNSADTFVDGGSFPTLKYLNSERKFMNKEVNGIDENHFGSIPDKKRIYDNFHDNANERKIIGDNEGIVQLEKHPSRKNTLHKHLSNIISRISLDVGDADASRSEENPRDGCVEWHQTRIISRNRGQLLKSNPIWEPQRLYKGQHLKRTEQSLLNRKDAREIYFDYGP